MNDAPIQIRNPEVVRNVRELAERLGVPLTEAVAEAVQRRLNDERAKDTMHIAERQRAIDKAVERMRALPRTGPVLTDDDLYDADGLPR